MGAENYMWVTRYQRSLAKALDTARRETFAAGKFLGAEKKPSSIAAALEAAEGDTGSLLDITGISKTPELCSVCSVSAKVRKAFFGTLVVSYPEGIATFRVTGDTCCIVGLEGGFTHYEIPAEVEGYPVTGIERIKNDTLESLTLPEGVVYIENAERYALWCKNLTSMNFPSTLRRIGTYADCHFPITALELNEGLEEIGRNAFSGSSGSKSETSTWK